MNYIYILNDITTYGYKVAFLDIFYFISILFGIYIWGNILGILLQKSGHIGELHLGTYLVFLAFWALK